MSNDHVQSSPQGSPHLSAASSSSVPPGLPSDIHVPAELAQMRSHMQRLFDELNAQRLVVQQAQQQAAAAAAAQQGVQVQLQHQQHAPRLPKIRQPSQFRGEMGFTVDDWLSELEQQFTYYGMADDARRIRFALANMAGPATRWWEKESKSNPVTTWDEFVACLHLRFRPVQAAMIARQRLGKLRQKNGQSVNAYANLFQTVLTPIGDMGDADQVHHFVNGLLPTLAGKVWERHPQNLKEAIDKAVSVEAILNFGRAAVSTSAYSFGGRGGAASSSSSVVPMDINHVSTDVRSGGDADDEAPADPDLSPAPMPASAPLGAIMAQLQAMEQRINALAQGSSSSRPSSSAQNQAKSKRVPGLSQEEVRQLRREGRCLVCKKVGHFKRECPNFQ